MAVYKGEWGKSYLNTTYMITIPNNPFAKLTKYPLLHKLHIQLSGLHGLNLSPVRQVQQTQNDAILISTV